MKKKRNIIRVNTWDWKSSRNTILIICAISLVIWGLTIGASNSYDRRLNGFDGKTEGFIVKIEPIKTMSQGFDGMKELTLGIYVTFTYTVGDNNYANRIMIESSQKQFDILNMLIRKNQMAVIIKYDNENPKKSLIQFDY